MVIGLPRSGTTWAANWLCTDRTHCIHDPTNTHHYDDLDAIPSQKTLGIADTGLWLFTGWLNAHPARKVVLHRHIGEVRAAMERLGLPGPPPDAPELLDKIKGEHRPWTDLFDRPEGIYRHLTGLPFDPERHAELRTMTIEPDLRLVRRDKEVGLRLLTEIMRDWGSG